MAEHTPGPWRVGDTSSRKGETYIYTDRPYPKGIGIAVAKNGYYIGEREANARMIAATPEAFQHLRSLEHLASVLNDRQHAGLKITPAMWSELYRECQEARAIIAKTEKEDSHQEATA